MDAQGKKPMVQVFSRLEIELKEVVLPVDPESKITGETVLQFASQELAQKVLGSTRGEQGTGNIEAFKSSQE